MGLAYHIAFGLSLFWVNVNTTLFCKENLGLQQKWLLFPNPVNLGKEIYQQQMWGPKTEVWISQVLNVL
jgi:hypothetical protein